MKIKIYIFLGFLISIGTDFCTTAAPLFPTKYLPYCNQESLRSVFPPSTNHVHFSNAHIPYEGSLEANGYVVLYIGPKKQRIHINEKNNHFLYHLESGDFHQTAHARVMLTKDFFNVQVACRGRNLAMMYAVARPPANHENLIWVEEAVQNLEPLAQRLYDGKIPERLRNSARPAFTRDYFSSSPLLEQSSTDTSTPLLTSTPFSSTQAEDTTSSVVPLVTGSGLVTSVFSWLLSTPSITTPGLSAALTTNTTALALVTTPASLSTAGATSFSWGATFGIGLAAGFGTSVIVGSALIATGKKIYDYRKKKIKILQQEKKLGKKIDI